MKKIMFVMILIVLGISAQAAYAVEFGVKGGVAFSTMSDLDALTSKIQSRAGVSVGAFASFKLYGPLSVQPEILYVQKGSKADIGDWGVPYILTTKLDYLEIPVLLKLSLTDGSLSPYLLAGPYAAFKTKSGRINVAGAEFDENDINLFSDSDFGVTMGVGAEWKHGFGAFLLEMRYSLGLSNIADSSLFQKTAIKNRSLSVMAGYSF